MPETETPLTDAADAAFRRRRGLDEPVKDDRTPEEIAAEQRRNAEARLERAGAARERKELASRSATVRRTLTNAVTGGLRHGVKLNTNGVDVLTRRIMRDLPGANEDAVRTFVKTAADAAADGDKQTGFQAAEETARSLVYDEGWKPAETADDPDEDLSPAELAARIPR
jgi:hypothetical protein